MLNTIHQFFEACHPFGYPLLVCSVLLLTAIFYQWNIYSKRPNGESVYVWYIRITSGTEAEQEQNAATLQKRSDNNAIFRLLLFIKEHKNCPDLTGIVESKLRQYIEKSRAGMSLIAIITNIAPMLGILGTAWGLVDIFGVFGTPGAQEGIALGISKALYTTIFGLAIAVPGIIAQTYFERALETEAADLNEIFTGILAMTHRQES